MNESLDLQSLAQRYRTGTTTPEAVVRDIYVRIEAYGDPALWIRLLPMDEVLERAKSLEGADPGKLSLYGIPFAIKDNLDLAGVPTTAGCPAYAYIPERSATVVELLLAAGAILIGKVNLDQFATGLVGTRSPYGVCRNPFNPNYIPGGSSSGSAVAVSAGLVSFALGTDTAGSGRVPAAFTNIVGLKPSKGFMSTRGLVPAVRSLDCVSIFALTCNDAQAVLKVAGRFDPEDPFSRRAEVSTVPNISGLRIGIPDQKYLDFFGNQDAERLYREAIAHVENLGCRTVTIDFQAFAETAQMLYGGPWIAERYAAVGKFLEQEIDSADPIVRSIILGGKNYDAIAAYKASYRLAELRRQTESAWKLMDIMAIPTTGSIYTVDEIAQEPIALNSNLGRYTNFANLLDLSAISVPSGFQHNGLPTGLTLVAPTWQEALLCHLGSLFHAQIGVPLGATGHAIHPALLTVISSSETIEIAVVGAHLTGEPLNPQLTDLGGTFVKAYRTAPIYRFYALAGTVLPKPGLVRVHEAGFAIEVEVWALSPESFGRFVAMIPAPLGVGTLNLDDGSTVKGFLCESYATADAVDISHLGGWRAYLSAELG
jgi:allophanate hydrolase